MSRRFFASQFALLFLAVFAAGSAGCKPSGEGYFEVLEPRFFESHTERLGASATHRVNGGSHPAEIEAGDHFDVDPGPNGRWNLDLWLTLKGAGYSTSLGGMNGYSCQRLAQEHVRCESVSTAESVLRGPARYTVDFQGEKIAAMTITELAPPSAFRAAVEDGARPNTWPKVVARFRDREFGWGERRFQVAEDRKSATDEDRKAAPSAGSPPSSAPQSGKSATSGI